MRTRPLASVRTLRGQAPEPPTAARRVRSTPHAPHWLGERITPRRAVGSPVRRSPKVLPAPPSDANARRRSQRPQPRASDANMRKVAAQRPPLRSNAKAARRYQTAPLRFLTRCALNTDLSLRHIPRQQEPVTESAPSLGGALSLRSVASARASLLYAPTSPQDSAN